MPGLLESISQRIDGFNQHLAQTIRWLALFMVLVTLAIVLLRYAFSMGAIMLQESVVYMHGLLFMLGIPFGLKNDTHVRVDIFYARLSTRQQHRIDLLGHLLLLLPVSVFIFVTSLPYVIASWQVLEGSSEVGGIPAIFLLKSLIPIMAALLFLQGLSQIAKCVLVLGEGTTKAGAA